MATKYNNDFKAMIVDSIVNQKKGTSHTATFYGIPLKTVEKWITAYNKDNLCFSDNYVSDKDKIKALQKQISELQTQNLILKKTIALLNVKD